MTSFARMKDQVRCVWNQEKCRENLGLSYRPRRHFAEASWQPHRSWYVIWRGVAAVYLVIWCFLSAIIGDKWYSNPANRIKYFIFLSDWNFVLMTISANLQLVVTLKYRPQTLDTIDYDDLEEEDEPLWYEKLSWLLYTITTDCALIVSAFFWLFIFKGGSPSAVTVHLHILNSAYVLIDLCLNAMPVRLLHCLYTIIYGLVYAVFVLVYHLSGGTSAMDEEYIYWILDWDYPARAMFFSALGVLMAVPAHLIVFVVYKVRRKLAEQREEDAVPLLDM